MFVCVHEGTHTCARNVVGWRVAWAGPEHALLGEREQERHRDRLRLLVRTRRRGPQPCAAPTAPRCTRPRATRGAPHAYGPSQQPSARPAFDVVIVCV